MTARSLLAGAALTAALFAMPAGAQDAGPTAPAPSPFGTDPVEAGQLETIAGQADVAQVVNAQNKAEVSRNSVSGNSVTGTIGMGTAFQNLNGLSVLSANTGNNVAINSSLNVNIAIHP